MTGDYKMQLGAEYRGLRPNTEQQIKSLMEVEFVGVEVLYYDI